MSCWRNPCSEYCSRFLETRVFSRVVSIHKFFSSGCARVTPMLPLELSNGVPDEPYCSEMLPLKSYCNPHGSRVPLMPELNVFASDVRDGVELVEYGL